MKDINVVVPEFEYRYVKAKKSRKSGRPRYWTVNGQSLYNATLHFQLRGKITDYYHRYLSKYIKKQISNEQIQALNGIVFPESQIKLAISVDIYEVRRPKMPDASNLWLWLKWFEDALQECGVIPDDDPNYVIQSGPTRYHWVDSQEERKLVFTLRLTNVC